MGNLGPRIAIVEDDDDTARMYILALKFGGITHVDRFKTGDAFAAVDPGSYDCAIIDVFLRSSQLDGVAVTRLVSPHVPCVVVTALDLGCRTQALAAGATAVLQKPVVLHDLVLLVHRLTGRGAVAIHS